MVPLTLEGKQFLFGAAGKKVSHSAAKSKATKTKKTTVGTASTGMLMAAGLGPELPPKDSSLPSKKKTATSTTKEPTSAEKRDALFKEINKYGMISLSAVTLINHTNTTVHKMIAAVHGDDNKFRFYEEKSRNYLKPHFSLPSQ